MALAGREGEGEGRESVREGTGLVVLGRVGGGDRSGKGQDDAGWDAQASAP